MNRIQRESKLDIEIPRESQRRRRTYLYSESMKQYRPNKVRPVSYSCRDSRAQISPGPLSRNRKSTHKVLAPRIDSKSRSTTRPTIGNHNQNGDKNNQRTLIEQRGSEPKGEKKNHRGETHNPKAYAHADHNRKIKPDPQPDPQSEITIHSTCSPTDFIFIIFESGGKGSLFCNEKKWSRFYSAQPNDASLGGRVVGIKLRFGSVGINLMMHPFGSVSLSSCWNQAPVGLKVP